MNRATTWPVLLALLGLASPLNPAWAEAPQAAARPRENLALDRTATASSHQDDGKWAGAAVDGDPGSRWCASDGSAPQWLLVDLGKPESLTGCRVVWEHDAAAYAYLIEGSGDGKTWVTLADSTAGQPGPQTREHPYRAEATRFVRLTLPRIVDGAHWASLYEFEVLGTREAPATVRRAQDRVDPASILREVQPAAGFRANVFAAPPEVKYPTCLAAAPGGEVFVGIDENGSLDAKPERGRVVRCRDTDGDGVADKFNVFATMDSPRGLVWDAGTMYVLHPPSLSVFRDTDGDGAADQSEVLVKNIGFGLDYRGADHTTNGIRLGIDGFLYVAVGDYGFIGAQGKDGPPLTMLGGGVVRVRTDGTGLSIVSRGQRNIYDVAISPRMDLFTRDNTNDGDGWDVRLSHVVPSGHYGYPSLFKRFAAETLAPLADYGGGSPCGSLFLAEPGFPAGFGNTLYTCEWGRGAVFRHPLTTQGATFAAGQEAFVTLPRPTDMDVDAQGQVFISTWRDGGFTYSKPTVGALIRVVPDGWQPKAVPDATRLNNPALMGELVSDSAVRRLAAQREILRRFAIAKRDDFTRQKALDVALQPLVVDASKPLEGRIAALWTWAQVGSQRAVDGLIGLTRTDPDLAEFALAALGDRRDATQSSPAVRSAVVACLADTNPRVRLAAVVAAGRLRDLGAATGLIALTSDPDPIVAHAAVRNLATLGAVDPCLVALADSRTAPGAVHALSLMHDERAVAGLVLVAEGTRGEAARRLALTALCRLYYDEAPYEPGKWWGTRPDTSGPYYKPVTWSGSPAIAGALQEALNKAKPEDARWLLGEMIRHKLDLGGSTAQAIRLAADDSALRLALVDLMAGRPNLDSEAVGFLVAAADLRSGDPASRPRALRALVRHPNEPNAHDAVIGLLGRLTAGDTPDTEVVGLWRDYTRDGRQGRDLARFARLAEGPDDGAAILGYGVLLAAAANSKATPAQRAEADTVLARAETNPTKTARLLRAIGLAQSNDRKDKVRALLTGDPRPEVHHAALWAAIRLGIDASNETKPTGAPGTGTGMTTKPVARTKPIIATPYEAVLAAVQTDKGDPALGGKLFESIGCANCHAVSKDGPLKGPYLGDVASRYNRAELVESILKPSARIAQGFETQKIALSDGRTIEGFVVREAGDEVELRNSTGNVVVVSKGDIDERLKGEQSVMPQGLLDPLTPHDLASLIAFLESLVKK